MSGPRLRFTLGTSLCLAALVAAGTIAAAQPAATGDGPISVTINAPRADGIPGAGAGPVRGWQALTSETGARVPTPLGELPQTVNVVPRQLIDEQGVVSLDDALRNVPGVQPLTPLSFGQVGFKIRGFAAERFVDGLPNYYDGGARDLMVNVERVEVLKGPGSIFHQGGASPIGGIVNVVSRLPVRDRFATFGVTAGTNSFFSPFLDVNQPLAPDGTALFRFTGQYEGTRDFIDVLDRRSYALNPSLTLTNNDGTRLTLQGHTSRRAQQDYAGLPAAGTLNRSAFSVRRDLFPGDPAMPHAVSTLQSLTARFDHIFNDVWSTFSSARIGRSVFDQPGQPLFQLPGSSNDPLVPPSIFAVWNGVLEQKTNEISANGNIAARFAAGPTRNRFLLGVDYNHLTDRGSLLGDFASGVDFANPAFPPFVRPVASPLNTFIDNDSRYSQMGVTAQMQTSILERLHLLGALKLAHVDIRNRALNTGTGTTSSETRALPRIGASFEVARGVNVFAAYNEGLRAVPFFTVANGPAPLPERSRQKEAGVKLDLGFGLSGTLAAFEILRENVAVPDPAILGASIQTGEQRSRGFEADVIWQPSGNWSFIGSYAYTEAVITRDTARPAGTPLDAVPRNAGRFWGTYRFTEGPLENLTIGAGLYTTSSQVVTLTPSANGTLWRTPGYTTFDARIGYRWRNVDASITGRNLTNTSAFVPYPYFDGRVAPLQGRVILGTVAVTF